MGEDNTTGGEFAPVDGPVLVLGCHACAPALAGLDRAQANFVRDLGITEEIAFLDYKCAPLSLRRDISILWVYPRKNPWEFPREY